MEGKELACLPYDVDGGGRQQRVDNGTVGHVAAARRGEASVERHAERRRFGMACEELFGGAAGRHGVAARRAGADTVEFFDAFHAAKIRLSRGQKQIKFTFCRDGISTAQPKYDFPLSVRGRSSIAADRIYRLLTPKAVPKVSAGHLRRDRTAVLTERAQNDVQQASAEAVRGLFRAVAVEAAQSFAPQRRSLS